MTAVEMVTRAGRAYYGISHAIACYTKASRGLSATAEFLLFSSYYYFSSIYFVFRTIVQLASLYETDALTFYNFILCLTVVGLTLIDGQA